MSSASASAQCSVSLSPPSHQVEVGTLQATDMYGAGQWGEMFLAGWMGSF